jgi:hypothetical protein
VSQATIWSQDNEASAHLADEYAARKQLFVSQPTLSGGGDRDRPAKFGDESAAFFTKLVTGGAAINSAVVIFRTGVVVHVLSVSDVFPKVVPPDADDLARKQLSKLNVKH